MRASIVVGPPGTLKKDSVGLNMSKLCCFLILTLITVDVSNGMDMTLLAVRNSQAELSAIRKINHQVLREMSQVQEEMTSLAEV